MQGSRLRSSTYPKHRRTQTLRFSRERCAGVIVLRPGIARNQQSERHDCRGSRNQSSCRLDRPCRFHNFLPVHPNGSKPPGTRLPRVALSVPSTSINLNSRHPASLRSRMHADLFLRSSFCLKGDRTECVKMNYKVRSLTPIGNAAIITGSC